MTVRSIASCIAHFAAEKPDATAITDDQQAISWRDLDRSTNRLARRYASAGVREGDFVVVAHPNGVVFYQACLAAWKLGATVAPISSRQNESERNAIIALIEPALVVGIDASGTVCLADANDCDDLSDAPLPDRTTACWKALASGGSTGRPKVIVTNMPGAFDPFSPPYAMRVGGTHLVAAPLYHNAAFIFSMLGLFSGNHIVVMPKFDAETMLSLVERHRAEWMVLVPTMMARAAKLDPRTRGKYDVSSLAAVYHTAAACAPWLKHAWIDWIGADHLYEIYGATEGCGAAQIRGDEWLERPGSVGRPMPGFRMEVRGEDGGTLAAGETGEVFMRPDTGPGSTYYYIGAEPRRSDDGWESVGDLGFIDTDGYLYLADRRTDLIISGGVNIYPAEVEGVIESIPGVGSCAVVGLADEDLGQLVHAIIEADRRVDRETILYECGRVLSRHKIPRSMEFVDFALRNEAGKVRRSALARERASSE